MTVDPTSYPLVSDDEYTRVPRRIVFQLVADSTLDLDMRLTLLACLGDLPRSVLLGLFQDLLSTPAIPPGSLNGRPYIDGRPVEDTYLP